MAVDAKKAYSYVVCLVSLMILLWGIVDIISASVSVITLKPQAMSYEPMSPEPSSPMAGEMKGMMEPSIEEYYQKRMVMDRVGDSLARILVSGLVFGYFSLKLRASEKA